MFAGEQGGSWLGQSSPRGTWRPGREGGGLLLHTFSLAMPHVLSRSAVSVIRHLLGCVHEEAVAPAPAMGFFLRVTHPAGVMAGILPSTRGPGFNSRKDAFKVTKRRQRGKTHGKTTPGSEGRPLTAGVGPNLAPRNLWCCHTHVVEPEEVLGSPATQEPGV